MDGKLEELLKRAVEQGASDIHLSVAEPPVFRMHGSLERIGTQALNPEELARFASELVPRAKVAEWQEGDTDFSLSVHGVGRFRVNVYRSRGSAAIAIRALPFKVPDFQTLGLPDVLSTLARRPHGLVLVTGPTGSGKSTTLAAMIDRISGERHCHIVTLEDPIEYLHRPRQAVINQREVGTDTTSFARGLRAALREDPDVILLGEMRDLETIEIGLQAAETGHLVLATLHTNSAPSAVERIISVFPQGQQQYVRVQVAGVIEGVVTQLLIPRLDQPGRVAAHEVLVATSGVRNLIREGKTHQLRSVIETGSQVGMRTMASSLQRLYEAGMIGIDHFAPYASPVVSP